MRSRVRSVVPRYWLPVLVVGIGVCLLMGCSLFSGAPSEVVSKRPSLPPIQTSVEAIQLEVYFVDRFADDPLLGHRLWREVDQIAAIPAETRENLHRNGFLVGHSGSSPPQVVQTLLGLTTDQGASDSTSGKPMIGVKKRLPPGIETEVQASDSIDRCHIRVYDADKSHDCDYDQARCLFRLKSARLRDGWIRIDFQPEIHYGEMRVRHTPTNDGWAYQNRQKVDVRQAQQFSLTMNVGEIAIITAAEECPETMGDLFFHRDDEGTRKQRLLIVRVADGGKSGSAY